MNSADPPLSLLFDTDDDDDDDGGGGGGMGGGYEYGSGGYDDGDFVKQDQVD